MRPSEIKEKLYLQAVFVYRQTCLLRGNSPKPLWAVPVGWTAHPSDV